MDATRSLGLRLTLRQQMIVVAFAAILCAATLPQKRNNPIDTGLGVARVVLLAGPWLLGGLVLLLDVPGPTRHWRVGCLLFAAYPASIVYLDLATTLSWLDAGACPRAWGVVIVNLLTLFATCKFYVKMRALDCPSCRFRTLIPLARLSGQSARVNNTRWCSCCGQQYWRDARGAWRLERRRTWANPPAPVSLEAPEPGPADMDQSRVK